MQRYVLRIMPHTTQSLIASFALHEYLHSIAENAFCGGACTELYLNCAVKDGRACTSRTQYLLVQDRLLE